MSDAQPLEKLLVFHYRDVDGSTANLLLAGQGPMVEGRIEDAPAELCRKVRALCPLIPPPKPFRIGTLALGPSSAPPAQPTPTDPLIPPKSTSLLVWEGHPVRVTRPGTSGITFEEGAWRKASLDEWATLRHGEVPFGISMPPPGIPFLDLYIFRGYGRRAGFAPSLVRAFEVATSPDEWTKILRALGFSAWQVTRVLAPRGAPPAFVPYGAELQRGPLGPPALPSACYGCKATPGERHAPVCPRRECPKCAGPNLAAGDLCQRCFKRERRLSPRAAWTGTGYEKPDKLSARCLQWWDRITALGWRPNRRINMMGYYTAAEFYGVWIWEYLHILSPALCALDGQSLNATFEGVEFGLMLPPPRAKRW